MKLTTKLRRWIKRIERRKDVPLGTQAALFFNARDKISGSTRAKERT